ncbi:glutamine synthetase family protein [Streptomyces albireticuli]|uniref:Glutamine synthetase n=1 Tax=Streptomyces albireticuli TaxID=1940 RepID=A0A2A2DCR8_9ACTN|nr:glutamine synthetase family protein [Streptomyces albireticuli]MCD9145819.1 glutamine synthetase family protein [Streptomyces albireticuli]MCD9165949.1 glutamine synthetase family protein [Streptomyces albireticuli]MCD9196179.1 glutamine synthetase family protein [Streptomyces albireticuli]PAU49092.1 glutamine synthetase [Streptomyces albireticuli]
MTTTTPTSAERTTASRPIGKLTLDGLRKRVQSGQIDTVLLALPDLQGRLKGKRYGARHFLDRIATGDTDMCVYVLATDVDMNPVDGFALTSWESGYQDLRAVPDLSTIRALPWMPRTALVHADAHDQNGQPLEVAPRQMLRHQLDRLADRGLTTKAGLETEFILYQGSYAQAAETGYQNLRPAATDNLDYALDHNPALDRFMRRLQAALGGAGLPVEAIKTESATGQVEVTFPYGDVLAACDGHTVFKHAVRSIAQRSGMAPTFMAAPETGQASGLHLHLSLWRGDQPALAADDGGLSPLALQAIAGLTDSLAAFAPTHLTWGFDNRTCAVRIVGHGNGLHIEIRLPGADANPYLALAAAVASVSDAIDNDLQPSPSFTGNAYEAQNARAVPLSLQEALDAFRDSPVVMKALGADAVEHHTRLGQIELDAHRRVVTDAERRRGFARA